MINNIKRQLSYIFLFILLIFLPVLNVNADNTVIVIDPGHGGDNFGGQNDIFVEQQLTLKVANYMRERLNEYDDVTVYLTHEEIGTKDLSRSERVEIAKKYNADFLFSLHFNMSENHNLYGSEVWTSAFGKYYSAGQEFAHIEMKGLVDELGFFDRGVKTRIGKKGQDYYGIIQAGVKNDIPTVIIEHCHMDESRDNTYLYDNGEEAYKTFGYLDADSVAKYFRLHSSSLGVDYSDYDRETFDAPVSAVKPDSTDPDAYSIELIDYDADALTANIRVTASDNDCRMQYYQYSIDNSEYSILYPWNDDPESNHATNDDSILITVPLTEGIESILNVKVHNMFDLKAVSNTIKLPAGNIPPKPEEEEPEIIKPAREYVNIDIDLDDTKHESVRNNDLLIKILMIVISVATVFTFAFIGINIITRRNRRRRRRR